MREIAKKKKKHGELALEMYQNLDPDSGIIEMRWFFSNELYPELVWHCNWNTASITQGKLPTNLTNPPLSVL